MSDVIPLPVQRTDEHGNPMHLTGIATSTPPPGMTSIDHTTYGGAPGSGLRTDIPYAEPGSGISTGPNTHQDIGITAGHRSPSSSSSSSEDDGQGGRRKKKGLRQKIKEKMSGGKHDDGQSQVSSAAAGVPPAAGQYYKDEHEKKGFMEKIKEKLRKINWS